MKVWGIFITLIAMAGCRLKAPESSFTSELKVTGNIVGNGGDVLVCEPGGAYPEIQLLDMYEAIYRQGVVPKLGAPELDVNSKIKLVLRNFSKDEWRSDYYARMAGSFMTDAEFLSDVVLTDLPDSATSSLPTGCHVEQIAIHHQKILDSDKIYTVNKNLWDRLDNDNKAALILHEIIYGLQSFEFDTNAIRTRLIFSAAVGNQLSGLNSYEYLRFWETMRVDSGDPHVAAWHGYKFRDNDGIKYYWGRIPKGGDFIEHENGVRHLSFGPYNDAQTKDVTQVQFNSFGHLSSLTYSTYGWFGSVGTNWSAFECESISENKPGPQIYEKDEPYKYFICDEGEPRGDLYVNWGQQKLRLTKAGFDDNAQLAMFEPYQADGQVFTTSLSNGLSITTVGYLEIDKTGEVYRAQLDCSHNRESMEFPLFDGAVALKLKSDKGECEEFHFYKNGMPKSGVLAKKTSITTTNGFQITLRAGTAVDLDELGRFKNATKLSTKVHETLKDLLHVL